MRETRWSFAAVGLVGVLVLVDLASGAQPAVTIYNQDFGVVRETIPLDLKQGVNNVRFAETTAHLEPDSVILRDPTAKHALQILEQNYRADPVSQELLLSLYEGKTIDFLVRRGEREEVVKGKIIRSGYVVHQAGLRRYGQQYRQTQSVWAGHSGNESIIEVDGTLRFGMPGTPLFPALTDEAILKPTLHWVLETDKPGRFDAELSYVTGGMSWEADYNLVAPPKGDTLDLIGWVTLDNQSGRTFENARIKLVAGDVSKLKPESERYEMIRARVSGTHGPMESPVTEKSFDEYHLYTLRRPTVLRDRETKQVEFVRASDVTAKRLYVYDGLKIDQNYYRGWSGDRLRQDKNYGTQSNPKVWVMREFENTEANHLGIALPKGRLRFYRRDDDGQLEFVGEDLIDHTPKGETARVYTGNAFDLVGERIRTDYKVDQGADWLDEAFKIKLRNHKKQAVEIRVVEHLYRWINWKITEKSSDYQKIDSKTIEFRVQVQPEQEKVITYGVHYTW